MPNLQHAQHWVRNVRTTWRSMLEAIFSPYRPELHYMRGPGPKWRARHGGF
jgi:hypothetical protein